MAVYYIDTYNGSDANTGLSWAQAWKTGYPLKAIYSGEGEVSNLELRFAKTPALETGRAITDMFHGVSSHSYCAGVARPLAGYRKAVVPDYPGYTADIYAWGGTVLSPFWCNAEAMMFRPAGTYKYRISSPAGADGLAARWTLTDGDFSSFQCFEMIGAFEDILSDDPAPAEVWLEFATDSAGSNIVWSRKLDVGSTQFSARMVLAGNNDLPSAAAYAFLRIKNSGTSTIHLHLSSIHAVLPVTHPNYVGLRLIYLPEDHFGLPLAPVSSQLGSGTWYTHFNGVDNSPLDTYRAANGLPARTWTTYRWEAYPYESSALLDSCVVAGSPSSPIKVYGGWNTATNEMDGMTALDAANIRLFNSARRVFVDVRRLGVACRRSGITYLGGVAGVMEYAGLGPKEPSTMYAEHVHVPAGGAGTVGEKIGYYYADLPRDALVAKYTSYTGGTAGFRHCYFGLTPPFSRFMDYTVAEDSGWGMSGLFGQKVLPRPTVRRCVLTNVRPILEGTSPEPGVYEQPPLFDDCDIVGTLVTNGFENGYASAPIGYLENCRLWGAHTGPVSHLYPAKNLTFIPLQEALGSMCTHGADIDGLQAVHNAPAYHSTDYMFARLGYAGEPVTVRLSNATVHVTFASLVPHATTWDYRGHNITMKDVVLHKTAAATGAPFNSSRLTVDNLTLVGAWSSLQTGVVRGTEVDHLVITDAATKIVTDFRFAAPAAGWGRVCASYRNVVHPLGLDGFLGTPGASSYTAAAAGWFHTVNGEMWASNVMTVRRDTTKSHSGMSSWRMTALQPLGAVSRGSFMLGVIPVVAGVQVTLSAYMLRDSALALGGLFIRPAMTREFVAHDTVNAPSLHDIVVMQNPSTGVETWEKVTVQYTPYRSGLIELHAGRRGIQGSSVWLDTIEVSQ